MISAAMDFWMITFRNFEGPSASCGESQFCSKNTPVGIDVPTTAGGVELGVWAFFGRRNRRGAGGNGGKYQPSGLSAEGGNDPEFRQTTSGAHGSAGRADCLPRGKPPACDIDGQFCRKKFPPGGLTRRLRRGWWGFRPEGGSTFFRSERKYQRKPAARRLQRRPAPLRVAGFGLREPFGLSSTSVRCAHPPGKSPLLPIFERGSSQCRAQHCWRDNSYIRARSCSLFSSFKKGKAFSLRCLSPLCSPAVGAGQTQISGAWSISL